MTGVDGVEIWSLQKEIEEEVSEEERRKKMQGRMAELGLALMANPEAHLAHLKELQVRRHLLSKVTNADSVTYFCSIPTIPSIYPFIVYSIFLSTLYI